MYYNWIELYDIYTWIWISLGGMCALNQLKMNQIKMNVFATTLKTIKISWTENTRKIIYSLLYLSHNLISFPLIEFRVRLFSSTLVILFCVFARICVRSYVHRAFIVRWLVARIISKHFGTLTKLTLDYFNRNKTTSILLFTQTAQFRPFLFCFFFNYVVSFSSHSFFGLCFLFIHTHSLCACDGWTSAYHARCEWTKTKTSQNEIK